MAIKIIKQLVFSYLTVVFLFQQSAMGKVSGQAAEPQPASLGVLIQSVRVLAYEFPDESKDFTLTLAKYQKKGFKREPKTTILTYVQKEDFQKVAQIRTLRGSLKLLINEDKKDLHF